MSQIHFQTTLGNVNWLQLTWIDGSTKYIGARLDVDDVENQNTQLNDMITRVNQFSPAEDIFSDDHINGLVSKAVTQDVAWQIENSRDCFTGAKDDSMYSLSNWELQTKGNVQAGQTYSWAQGSYTLPRLMLSGYNNIVADGNCKLTLDQAAIPDVCIVPPPDPNGNYGDYAVTDDNDAAFSWKSADTSFRFETAATVEYDQCLTGISGQFLTWHIGHIGYTFYTMIEPAPDPVPIVCEVCPDPEEVAAAAAAAAAAASQSTVSSVVDSVAE